MRMSQLGSRFTFSELFRFITSVKLLLLYRRHTSLSIAEADFLNLCEHKVHIIEDLVKGGDLLNNKQCLDLSGKLSKAFKNIKELVVHCGASSTDLFRPALENLYRILEKAKVLVGNCCHEDWCASSVFQFQNEKAFQEILLELGLCYNAIYELASKERSPQLEDLRGSSTFQPASASDIDEDNHTLQKWLEDLASEPQFSIIDCFLPGRLGLKQSLARYLLVKLKCISQRQSQGKDADKSSAILWTEDTEPSGTWNGEFYLGAGAGAKVWSTKWLGIPCAKKVFQGVNIVSGNDTCIFSKEAGILAYLNHPRVVKFFCCGSGQETGDGFIAMELMEMSLCDLIRKQIKPFPLPVAVDIIMQIARGMCYLHEVEVAHRDLKPQNVVVNRLTYPHLLDEYYCVKLVDFGMSKTKVKVHRAHTISVLGVGTTIYRAPEVHPQAQTDGKQGKALWFNADVYSFAVTCSEILTLQRPYRSISKMSKMYEELINRVRPDLPMDCPPELVSLLTDCWDPDPTLRPSFSQICSRLEAFSHKFILAKMEEPSSVPRQDVAVSDDEERPSSLPRQDVAVIDDEELESHRSQMFDTQETTLGRISSVSSGGTSDGASDHEVKTLTRDPHKDAHASAKDLSKSLETVPSDNGESCRTPRTRRRRNINKTGADKPPKSEAKKVTSTSEVLQHQRNSGEGKKIKEPSGRKADDCTNQTGNAKKRGKRKQALDEPTAGAPTSGTPAGKLRNEAPTKELKKRPRRDADKRLGESRSLNEAWTVGDPNSLPEELARTLTGFLEPHSWHISNRDGVKVVTLEYIEPDQKKVGRKSRKNSGKSRVKTISSGCSRVG
ncbi:hypothetical protein M758_6G044400 [Ceratodon purpureus]|nr:hypothetical protein M758_6G044400 [Ceratodon purpureus]